jgi:ABC-type nickel/cobalt efflux system permease component RcnA
LLVILTYKSLISEKLNYKKSLLGSSLAFILATSCCWLPALIIMVGGGSALFGLSSQFEKLSGVFIAIGLGLLVLGSYQYYQKKKKMRKSTVLLASTITCPNCEHKEEETMPTNACQYFYECKNCTEMLKPKLGDCCVFCSYGTVACPPIQLDQDCC